MRPRLLSRVEREGGSSKLEAECRCFVDGLERGRSVCVRVCVSVTSKLGVEDW